MDVKIGNESWICSDTKKEERHKKQRERKGKVRKIEREREEKKRKKVKGEMNNTRKQSVVSMIRSM